jgi:large-conductance mechanosensitive channel
MLVKGVNKIKETAERNEKALKQAQPSTPSAEIALLTEIRDLLKK